MLANPEVEVVEVVYVLDTEIVQMKHYWKCCPKKYTGNKFN